MWCNPSVGVRSGMCGTARVITTATLKKVELFEQYSHFKKKRSTKEPARKRNVNYFSPSATRTCVLNSRRRAERDGVHSVKVGGTVPDGCTARFVICVAVRVRAVGLCYGGVFVRTKHILSTANMYALK